MTLLGYSTGEDTGAGWNRQTIADTRRGFEAAVRARSGLPSSWHTAANRRHYYDITASFPPSGTSGALGNIANDITDQVLPIVTVKVGPPYTWAQMGAAATGQAIWTDANNWAQDIADWQDLHRGIGKWGCSFALYFHHEPEGDARTAATSGATTFAQGTANWRAACEKLYAILVANGVSIWKGTNSGQTTQEGCMIGMINLTAGPFATRPPSTTSDTSTEVPNGPFMFSGLTAINNGFFPDNWDWGNDNITHPSCDVYNRPAQWGAAEWYYNLNFGSWWTRRRAFMEARHPWLPCILETGTEAVSAFTTFPTNRGWPIGLATTVPNWFRNMANYVNTTSFPWWLICMWDSIANYDMRIDKQLADWQCWVDEIIPHAAWLDAPPVPPPTISSFLPLAGPVQTLVAIVGTNLLGTTIVRLNGQPCAFTVNSDTQVTAEVPTAAASGLFQVVTPTGSASSATAYTVTTVPLPPTFHPGVVSPHTRIRSNF